MGFKKDQSQDLQEYVNLMISHQTNLRAFIYSQLAGSADVDDVLQNTNAVLWQKRESFKVGTNFLAWAFKIARYQVQHQRGRIKRDGGLVFSEKLVEQIADTAPTDGAFERRFSVLEGCIGKLTESQRELINERYTPGHTLEKHTQSRGQSAGSLRIALHRVRDLLKLCVERTLAEEAR